MFRIKYNSFINKTPRIYWISAIRNFERSKNFKALRKQYTQIRNSALVFVCKYGNLLFPYAQTQVDHRP